MESLEKLQDRIKKDPLLYLQEFSSIVDNFLVLADPFLPATALKPFRAQSLFIAANITRYPNQPFVDKLHKHFARVAVQPHTSASFCSAAVRFLMELRKKKVLPASTLSLLFVLTGRVAKPGRQQLFDFLAKDFVASFKNKSAFHEQFLSETFAAANEDKNALRFLTTLADKPSPFRPRVVSFLFSLLVAASPADKLLRRLLVFFLGHKLTSDYRQLVLFDKTASPRLLMDSDFGLEPKTRKLVSLAFSADMPFGSRLACFAVLAFFLRTNGIDPGPSFYEQMLDRFLNKYIVYKEAFAPLVSAVAVSVHSFTETSSFRCVFFALLREVFFSKVLCEKQTKPDAKEKLFHTLRSLVEMAKAQREIADELTNNDKAELGRTRRNLHKLFSATKQQTTRIGKKNKSTNTRKNPPELRGVERSIVQTLDELLNLCRTTNQ